MLSDRLEINSIVGISLILVFHSVICVWTEDLY